MYTNRITIVVYVVDIMQVIAIIPVSVQMEQNEEFNLSACGVVDGTFNYQVYCDVDPVFITKNDVMFLKKNSAVYYNLMEDQGCKRIINKDIYNLTKLYIKPYKEAVKRYIE